MNTISTHVLDTTKGRPAQGVPVLLESGAGKSWKEAAKGKTDADGRVPGFLPEGAKLAAGVYRLTFDTAAYFKASGVKGFYPVVKIVFEVGGGHYHVPLLLSPFGYSTYRGS